ncbi:MAG: helix-turn-helix domain-containing protein [Candidatus Pacebacteria bacterium]|nr:helix-turn-helix domain-containing protein [Candidatus Paceibacterota bacterium]MCF7862422.1 helix-turn-helix domain-containing protein [Candidatus Paceibacterota bacterium]
MTNNLILTTKEVAKILNISTVAVFKRIKSGKLKAEKIGRNYLIPRSEVLKGEEKDFVASPSILNDWALVFNDKLEKKVFLKKGETVILKWSNLFEQGFDINGEDIIVGFNEPKFKKSKKGVEDDLDSPLNARLITYFLPAVQIAREQKKKPRLIIVTGINAALRYNAKNDFQRKVLYRNNMLKLSFIKETIENFFPDAFSLVETRLAYDFMKISEKTLDQLWELFKNKYPERVEPLAKVLARFSTSGSSVDINSQESTKEAFRYAVLHLFVLADVNLDNDFIHSPNGYCSIGEHQELVFNIIREIGYEMLKDIGSLVFNRDVFCFQNTKIIIDDEGKAPPSYNGSFKEEGGRKTLDEVTFENNLPLNYYDTRGRLKPHMDYLYKIIPREVYEKYWNNYKNKYFDLKAKYNMAYDL